MKNDFPNVVVVKRNGDAAAFNPSKISVAITKAFIEVFGKDSAALMTSTVDNVVEMVVAKIVSHERGSIHIEDIQDFVELCLMRADQLAVAKSYILYRGRQEEKRKADTPAVNNDLAILDQGKASVLTEQGLLLMVAKHCTNLEVDAYKVARQARRDLFNNCSFADVRRALTGAARTLIETEPDYSILAARLTIGDLYNEILGEEAQTLSAPERAQVAFIRGIQHGVKVGQLNPAMEKFDLIRLAEALRVERDDQFDLIGIQTLYDRYFLHTEGRRYEAPQGFFMRVAMGLALNEKDCNARAIEFYNVYSQFDFMSSTPTLFNSGCVKSQLSSCYLTTIPDDLEGIFKGITENALLQKFAGGLGNDWTPVRAMGSLIKGTNGDSQGVVPFLKVVNDTAVAVNQGGKRKGAVCAYLETWHLDIEEFLELRKNTGDDRRRTHDMNTANWVPDLFMKRVFEKGTWTLFSPNDVPDLHELYGSAFEVAYNKYEALALAKVIKQSRVVQAAELWRKMLTMLFETGHPWITFKDPCNLRSPQRHVGVVHSSNLCTEITLNTSDTETAVCNLGSVNLKNHLKDGQLDIEKLKRTVNTAMRMLDNVIDVNYYGSEKARNSNVRHRPVAMGIMGFQDALHELKVSYDSEAAAVLADVWQEAVCYWAYSASADLAQERGSYDSFVGSTWHQGIMPLDTIAILEQERGRAVDVNRESRLDWDALRTKVMKGMRNSNCIAIAPTATIGNIVGVEASIEPTFGNLSVKSNLAGEFTVINAYLVRDLKALGLWDSAMIVDLKAHDGSVQNNPRVPPHLREQYKTAFELDTLRLIDCASRRQKWIDQAQSLNIYMKGVSGRTLDTTYKTAWEKGLKTTYYLRTISATQAEKSTIDAGALNAVKMNETAPEPAAQFCSISDPGCESCQ